MLNSIRTSFKDSMVYGLGNIAVKVIGFLLIPLYTDKKYFTVDDFGTITILDITALILIALMASGLPQSFMRWYWDKEQEKNQKGIFFMSMSMQFLVSALFCILLFPLAGKASQLLFSKADWGFVIKLLILSAALQSVNNIVNTLMRIQAKAVLFSLVNFSKLFIVLLLTVYFIVFRKLGVEGIYIAQVIGNLIFLIILAGYIIKNARPYVNLPLLREMGKYGFPLLLSNVAAASITVIDRFSLNSLTALKFVAIYGLAYKISSVLKMVIVDSIKMAITPMAMKKINSPDNHRFYSKNLLYSSFIVMLGIIFVSLFSFEVLKIIAKSKDYWDAFAIVPLLSISVFFTNLRETSNYGLIINKRTGIIGIIVVVSSLLNIILNIVLIPYWNMYGAAVATIVTQCLFWYMCYHYSQKEYYIPFEIKKVAIMLICGSALSFGGLLINNMYWLPRILIKLAMCGSFPFILYLFNFYEPVELQAIKGFAKKWSRPGNLKENIRSLVKTPNEF